MCDFSNYLSPFCYQNKYKELVKKHLPHGSFTKLPQTRDTAHVKEVTKNVSEVSCISVSTSQSETFAVVQVYLEMETIVFVLVFVVNHR